MAHVLMAMTSYEEGSHADQTHGFMWTGQNTGSDQQQSQPRYDSWQSGVDPWNDNGQSYQPPYTYQGGDSWNWYNPTTGPPTVHGPKDEGHLTSDATSESTQRNDQLPQRPDVPTLPVTEANLAAATQAANAAAAAMAAARAATEQGSEGGTPRSL